MGAVRGVIVAFLLLATASSLQPQDMVQTATGDHWVPPAQIASASTTFTENVGQIANEQVRYYAREGALTLGLGKSRVLLRIDEPRAVSLPSPFPDESQNRYGRVRGALLRVTFPGAADVEPEGVGLTLQRSHFFLGNDPARWWTDVRSYNEVVFRDLYEGVDLRYSLSPQGVKYVFSVQSGGAEEIRLRYEGIEELSVGSLGDLTLSTAAGDVVDTRPVALQEGHETPCDFVLGPERTVAIRCDQVDLDRPFLIDPLVFATYLGDGQHDTGESIAVDGAGNAYLAGATNSPGFPTTVGAFDILWEAQDAYVTRMAADGASLLYSTFIGGSMSETGRSIALDGAGNVYLAGETRSQDFPMVNATDGTYNGGNWDGFLTVLDAAGSALLFSTYLGGNQTDLVHAIALAGDREVIAAGATNSTDFPTTPGAFDIALSRDQDAFVTKINTTGSPLTYSTYLGGDWWEVATALAVDAAGNAYVVGDTNSSDYPVTPQAFDPTFNGIYPDQDIFVTKMDPSGSALVYSTFLGSSGGDSGIGLFVDALGSAFVVGTADAPDYPVTPGAYDVTFAGLFPGSREAIVTKLNANGSALVYSTFLGGSSWEWATTVTVDSSGNAYIAGVTASPDFPTTPGSFDRTQNGTMDGYVAKLNENGTELLYSTYLGGSSSNEGVLSAALFADTDLYVTGQTTSSDFPTTPGAYDRTFGGGRDAFVIRFGATAPDLAVASGALSVTPPIPFASVSAQYTANVTNQGDEGTDWFATTLFEDLDGDSLLDVGEEIGVTTVDSLQALNWTSAAVPWIPATPSTHRLCAWADSTDAQRESDESNNLACLDVLAVAPPAYFPPLNVTTMWDGNSSLGLLWEAALGPAPDQYLIYRAADPRGFGNLTAGGAYASAPFPATSWTDPEPLVAAGERYYLLRAADTTGFVRSPTSNTAGVFAGTLDAGATAISRPLEYFPWVDYSGAEANTVEEHRALFGASSVEYLENGQWRPVPGTGDPAKRFSVGDTLVVHRAIPGIFVVTGLPGSMLSYDEGFGFDPATDGRSLTAAAVGTDVELSWAAPAGAGPSDTYEIWRSDSRAGFFEGTASLAGTVIHPQTTLTDPGILSVDGESYYWVVPVSGFLGRGSPTYSIGVWARTFSGTMGVGLPLRADIDRPVSWYADAVAGTLGIVWLSPSGWVPHFAVMPAGVYDAAFVLGGGVQWSVLGTVRYAFVGY